DHQDHKQRKEQELHADGQAHEPARLPGARATALAVRRAWCELGPAVVTHDLLRLHEVESREGTLSFRRGIRGEECMTRRGVRGEECRTRRGIRGEEFSTSYGR